MVKKLVVLLSVAIVVITHGLIERVAIIGGGTGGLSLAAALNHLSSGVKQVTVFESRENFLQAQLGGGVQLTGGAAVLERLNCLPVLKEFAQPLRRIISRNASGRQLLELNLHDSIRTKDWAAAALCEGGSASGQPMTYAIMRDKLLDILHQAATANSDYSDSDTSVSVEPRKQCVGIEEQQSDSGVSIKFSDGTTASSFDLVVGADGVGSSVREFIGSRPLIDLNALLNSDSQEANINEGDSISSSSSSSSGRGGSVYSGIRIAYCVTPAAVADDADADNALSASSLAQLTQLRQGSTDAFHQWFGDGAYALAASYGGGCGSTSSSNSGSDSNGGDSTQSVQHMLAVVYTDSSDSPFKENAEWRVAGSSSNAHKSKDNLSNGADTKQQQQEQQGMPQVSIMQPRDVVKQRLKNAGFDSNSEIQSLLAAASLPGGRFFDLGVRDYTIPLDRWSSDSGRVILLGDSAHAMAPFLGQGANQAIQDGYCLATLITDYNKEYTSSKSDFKRSVANEFERRRKSPTAKLAVKSNILGRIETLSSPIGCLFKDVFFATMGKIGVAEKVYLEGAIPKV